ncbi:MAG: tRNA (adenosine(37)-N6)-threonylcarbamoyltransferase complex ATPase subunit type 1 TsaE [Pseudomonadota bacterium]
MSEPVRLAGLDEAGMSALGAAIAGLLTTRDRVALIGDMGAGKTTLARSILRALAANAALEVASPTFTIIQDYPLDPPVRHVDLYRIADAAELDELGLGDGEAIELIEWPIEPLPITVSIAIEGAETRAVTVTGMPERLARDVEIARFLTSAGWGNAAREPLAADASSRDYQRLSDQWGRRAVLMDAPASTPPKDSYAARAGIADGNPHAFLAVGGLLAKRGFTIPEPLAADTSAGLLLLSDLGDEKVAIGDEPQPERYLGAAEALAVFHNEPVTVPLPPGPFGKGHAPPTFDADLALTEVALFCEWALGQPPDQEFLALWRIAIEGLWRGDDHLALRDVHSPNLMWCDDKEGVARIGFIDYQDAMIAPSAYDVVSLADDARLPMPIDLSSAVIERYLECRVGLDYGAWRETAPVVAAQRATRVIGVFHRLAQRDGKPRYMVNVPRIAAGLARDLKASPALSGLRAWFAANASELVPVR